jgi:hypothetical protein
MPAFYGLAALISRGSMRQRAFEKGEWPMANGEWPGLIRHWPLAIRRSVLAIALGVFALWVAACGASFFDDEKAGLSCVDDSPRCVAQREATLKAMLADKSRSWVKEAPTAHAHASGVRLFAFRATKAALTCEELAHGRREAEAAPKALKGHPGLSPAQVSRASLFATEVQRELAGEMKRRRCRA